MIQVYWIRHAESFANTRPDIISGRSNETPLTTLGELQAMKLKRRLDLEALHFDEIYVSPAVRTQETARRVLSESDFSRIKYDEQLQELDQGSLTGLRKIEVYTPEWYARVNGDYWHEKAIDGESQAEVAARGVSWLKEIVKCSIGSKKIGVFGHGGMIKYTLVELLDMRRDLAWRIPIDNTSITCLEYHEDVWLPLCVNDSAHLRLAF
ncbi:histidine phosphatase family protein [Candidatus Pacearchaeota archaeon]|nr:histidine phosphatase family protein [Candidatus Pacearchaeota archaeon]